MVVATGTLAVVRTKTVHIKRMHTDHVDHLLDRSLATWHSRSIKHHVSSRIHLPVQQCQLPATWWWWSAVQQLAHQKAYSL